MDPVPATAVSHPSEKAAGKGFPSTSYSDASDTEKDGR